MGQCQTQTQQFVKQEQVSQEVSETPSLQDKQPGDQNILVRPPTIKWVNNPANFQRPQECTGDELLSATNQSQKSQKDQKPRFLTHEKVHIDPAQRSQIWKKRNNQKNTNEQLQI